MKTKPFSINEAKAGARVVTRDGNEVNIISFASGDKLYPIEGVIKGNTLTDLWTEIGLFSEDLKERRKDLLLVSEEEELTEFEKEIERFRTHILTTGGERYNESGEYIVKKYSKKLLELAKKELQLADNTCVEYALNEAYTQGREDCLENQYEENHIKPNLTTDDIKRLFAIEEQLMDEITLGDYIDLGEEKYCEEILKRYNKHGMHEEEV